MLSERAFRWHSLIGSTFFNLFILFFIRDKKTGGLQVGSWFLLTVFQICSFPGKFHLAYSIVSIILEIPKSKKDVQAIFFSSVIFSLTLVELSIFDSIVSAKKRMLKIFKDLRKLSGYCGGKIKPEFHIDIINITKILLN